METDTHTHDDHAVRVGYFLAWRCSICGRIETTDVDLRHPVAVRHNGHR